MKNCEVSIKDQLLTIKVDLSKELGKSKSGKSNMIATTNGNVYVPMSKGIKFGLNVYKETAVSISK